VSPEQQSKEKAHESGERYCRPIFRCKCCDALCYASDSVLWAGPVLSKWIGKQRSHRCEGGDIGLIEFVGFCPINWRNGP